MTEVKKDEYIEINISKMLIAILKNIKTFATIIFLGVLLSGMVTYVWKPSYTYQQIIQPPLYIGSKGQVSILGNDTLATVLQNIVAGMQQSHPENQILNNVDVIAPTKSDTKYGVRVFFTISTKSKYENKDQVNSELDGVINKFSQSPVIKNQVELWQQDIERNIDSNKRKLIRYNNFIKKNQYYLKDLASQKRLSGIDGQTLLSSYINRIDSYQKAVFSIEDSQNELELKLKSIKTGLSAFGYMTYTKISKLSVAIIFILGLVLSIFMASIVIFLKVTLLKAIKEYKNDIAD